MFAQKTRKENNSSHEGNEKNGMMMTAMRNKASLMSTLNRIMMMTTTKRTANVVAAPSTVEMTRKTRRTIMMLPSGAIAATSNISKTMTTNRVCYCYGPYYYADGCRYFSKTTKSRSSSSKSPSMSDGGAVVGRGSSTSTSCSSSSSSRSREEKETVTTLRLYRVLLRTVRSMTRTKKTTNIPNPEKSKMDQQKLRRQQILLQPPLDPHGWGRHSTFSTTDSSSDTTAGTTVESNQSDEQQKGKVYLRHLMELYRLFFVWNWKNNRSLSEGRTISSPSSGGRRGRDDADYDYDDLDNYDDDDYDDLRNDDGANDNKKAWYHIMMKQMKYIAEDPAAAGSDATNTNNDTVSSPIQGLPPMTSQTLWTTPFDIECAIRHAFKTNFSCNSRSNTPAATTTSTIERKDLHSYAIYANQLLREQSVLWNNSSTCITNSLVRVTATSQCIERGTSSSTNNNSNSVVGALFPPPQQMVTSSSSSSPSGLSIVSSNSKYRYAYRIRVENVSRGDDETTTTVQLVGRYWNITELHKSSTDDPSSAASTQQPPPIEVNAPYTGAVGQLPVLKPGEVFEYMSGTELGSSRGVMKGHLFMAVVPETTISAKSGDEVDALKFASSSSPSSSAEESQRLEEQLFEATVAPFPLDGDG